MKKILALALALILMGFTMQSLTEENVMTHDEFISAEIDSRVTVEAYIQAIHSGWEYIMMMNLYAQDKDGAYYIFNMPCSLIDGEKLFPGTKIRIKGTKSSWQGEIEITNASVEIIDSEPYIAEAKDVTEILGTDELIKYQNMFVSFKGMKIDKYVDENGEETNTAIAYAKPEKKDGDIYFQASKGDVTINFCVETDLCDKESDIYKSVEKLKVGNVIDVDGFLFWYNGNPNPHVTKIEFTKK